MIGVIIVEMEMLNLCLEIQALIGLLYLAGVLESNCLNVDELWSINETGIEISD